MRSSTDGFLAVAWASPKRLICVWIKGMTDDPILTQVSESLLAYIRMVSALVQGAEGQEVWQNPTISQYLVGLIQDGTGVKVNL